MICIIGLRLFKSLDVNAFVPYSVAIYNRFALAIRRHVELFCKSVISSSICGKRAKRNIANYTMKRLGALLTLVADRAPDFAYLQLSWKLMPISSCRLTN